MKYFVFTLVMVFCFGSVAFAFDSDNKRPYKDSWGNSYKTQDNLYKDSDKDGVINKYDYNDKNKNVQTPYQKSNSSNPYNKGKRYNN